MLKNGGVSGSVSGCVNETQQKIITLIAENPNITAQEIADKMNFTKRKIEYNIKILKEKGFIKRIGSDKTGHWQIIKSINNNSSFVIRHS